MRAKFEKNLQFLQRTIAPDDIYVFAEQTFMAALFFIHKWSNCVDINIECNIDPVVKKWVTNIMMFQEAKDIDEDVQINLNLESLEDE